MEIGEEKSLLSELLGSKMVNDTITPEPEKVEEVKVEDEIKQDSLLFEVLSSEVVEQEGDTSKNFKAQYEEKVKSGEWQEIDGAEDVDWTNEANFKKIEEAQKKLNSDGSDNKDENSPTQPQRSANEDVAFRQGRIEALNNTDFDDVSNAKELVRLYKIQQDGEDNIKAIEKQIEALDDEELVQYAKTISAKIIKDDSDYIKEAERLEKERAKQQEENWNNYQNSVIEVGNKLKITPQKSKEKLEKVKNGEFNKKLWENIADPEKFHKVYDFLMDIDKYEEKIKNKASSKLVVDTITKKNLNFETKPTNTKKINIPI